MSKITKQAYEAKSRYASRSNSENAEIMEEAGASQELIDSILRIVSIRHDLHSGSRSSLFNTESSDFDSKWEQINELQEFVSETVLDEFNSPLDSDWSMGLVDTDEFESFDDFSQRSIVEISNKIEKLNTLVEKKLQEIDKEFGTSWTPSGASRIF
jgi:hypothetical protein